MRLQPRQEILEIWRSVARASWDETERAWRTGGADAANSISDAEQILCLMMPAAALAPFQLDRPDFTEQQALDALDRLGTASTIPRALIQILTDYFERYTVDGVPDLSGGSRLGAVAGEPTADQARLDVVDSYAISVTLTLATLGFLRTFRATTRRHDTLAQVDRLEEMAGVRLSAAMSGLLRSFSVNAFAAESPSGRTLLRTVNQANLPAYAVVRDLRRALRQTTASIRDIRIGSIPSRLDLVDTPDMLYECGWSWGVIAGAGPVNTLEPIGPQPPGVAEDAPYLYFTVVAMNAVEDLFSERTRILGLLNEDQQRLARALQLRYDLARSYWTTIATFGGGRWPLEDMPWCTTDDVESEYFTLQVASLAMKGMYDSRESGADLPRMLALLNELANRARITRRAATGDPAVMLHSTGVRLHLGGSEALGPQLTWSAVAFAPLLLQQLARLAGIQPDVALRGATVDLADLVWDHLRGRRFGSLGSAESLWDRPEGVFPMLGAGDGRAPSWSYTMAVVEALVTTANALDRPPLRSERVAAVAADLLAEADQILDNELMSGIGAGGPVLENRVKEIRVMLQRARSILVERPGTAAALSMQAMQLLDELAAGRQNASEVS